MAVAPPTVDLNGLIYSVIEGSDLTDLNELAAEVLNQIEPGDYERVILELLPVRVSACQTRVREKSVKKTVITVKHIGGSGKSGKSKAEEKKTIIPVVPLYKTTVQVPGVGTKALGALTRIDVQILVRTNADDAAKSTREMQRWQRVDSEMEKQNVTELREIPESLTAELLDKSSSK